MDGPIGGTPSSCGASWNPEDRCWLFPGGECTVVPDWDKYIPEEAAKGIAFGYWPLVLIGVIVIAVLFLRGRR